MNAPQQTWVLRAIWDFAQQPRYVSEEAFCQAVAKYYAEVEEYAPEIKASDWQAGKPLGDFSQVTIQYSYYDGSTIATRYFTLTDLPNPVTAGHLLYRIHNQVVDVLSDLVHTHFEGLQFVAIDVAGHPLYEMHLGS